ncbi:hypothetical protein [Citricoccus sp. NR2]|nr:hypothetical protein [Citricoccus sp. NR2]WBL19686.1 hypothetical protein O1A05_03040 [Citricoccus sp. NR2]
MNAYTRTYDILIDRTTSLTEHIATFRERLTAAHRDFQAVDEDGQASLQQLFQHEGWQAREVNRILGEMFSSPIFKAIPGIPGPVSPFVGVPTSGTAGTDGD